MRPLVSLVPFLVVYAGAQNLPVPPLHYEYGAMEPLADEASLRIHHLGHHAAATRAVNEALEKMRWDENNKHLAKMGLDELLHNLDQVPEEYQSTVRNNGGGYVNHALFWESISPWGGHPPSPEGETIQERKLSHAIDAVFGDFATLQRLFGAAAVGVFGSGWAFLYYDTTERKLAITSTSGNDTPAMDKDKKAILCLDMWEHAWVPNHTDKHEYIDAFWKVADWPSAARRFAFASGLTPAPVPNDERREKMAVGLMETHEGEYAMLRQ